MQTDSLPLSAAETGALMPPRTHDSMGKPRGVGVEIEFLELGLEETCAIITRLFGGRVEREHDLEMRVVGTSLGDFHVEVDSQPLKKLAKKRRLFSPLGAVDRIQEIVFGAVQHVTPNELSTAPLLPEQLGEVDRLVHALGRAGAEGTAASLMYVLGVHLNPSVPSIDPLVLRDHIRAYVLLHEWLVEALQTDISRRVMRFATPYPVAYARVVLDPRYTPGTAQLIDDYLIHNPTRNRGLDLLPLFAHMDGPRVFRTIKDERVAARPTFHFRLPNSQVHDPSFSITDEWKMWLEVERLANDPARLERLSQRALKQLKSPFALLRRKWDYARPRRRSLRKVGL